MKFILKGNMEISKIANCAEYRMDKHSQNFLIFEIFIFFQINKFQKYLI